MWAAGPDSRGRATMWNYGRMWCMPGGQRSLLHAMTLRWLALHADLTTLRHGLSCVHDVSCPLGIHSAPRSTRWPRCSSAAIAPVSAGERRARLGGQHPDGELEADGRCHPIPCEGRRGIASCMKRGRTALP